MKYLKAVVIYKIPLNIFISKLFNRLFLHCLASFVLSFKCFLNCLVWLFSVLPQRLRNTSVQCINTRWLLPHWYTQAPPTIGKIFRTYKNFTASFKAKWKQSMQTAQMAPQTFKKYNKNETTHSVFWSDNMLIFCSV